MGGTDQFFLSGTTLPVMPEVARQLIASFDDENVDMQTVVDLTRRDLSLALSVLRLANSARYKRSYRAATLHEAAGLLGMERLRNLVLAASIAAAFPKVSGLDRIAFWKHAIASGGYARWLARITNLDPDSAYLAGFLLRTGQILMAQSLPQAVAAVECSCTEPGMRWVLEQRMLGCNHAQITAELARRWQLPVRLIDAFRHAPEPTETRPFPYMAAVLNLAATLADAGALEIPPELALARVDARLFDHLRLDVPWLQTTAPTFEDLTAPVDELLG